MNKKSRVSLGPGAPSLILIIVVLTLSVLGMLALMNARNDVRFSRRSAEVIEKVYQLNAQAEEHFAQLDELLARSGAAAGDEEIASALPVGMQMDGDVVSWIESDGYRTLDCAAQVLSGGEGPRLKWIRYDLTSATEEGF